MAKAAGKNKPAKLSLADKAAKLSAAAKAAVFIVTGLALGGAFYGLVFTPYSEEEARLSATIAAAKQEITTNETALKKHQAVGKLSETVHAAYLYIKTYLPVENEMPRLVQMVSDIASKAGMTDGVTLFAPKLPAQVKEDYAEIPFTLNLEGEFLTVLNFLYDFSRLNRIINVTEVSIGSPKVIDAHQEIFFVPVKCTGSTYRSLTEAEMAAPAAKGKK